MLNELLDAFSYGASSLDKLGPRPLRGLLAGKPREALSFLPFSDASGITDPRDIQSGRNVTDKWGITGPTDPGWGAWGAGLAAEAALDPLALYGGVKAGLKGLGALSSRMRPSMINPVHRLAGLLGDPAAAGRASHDLIGTADRLRFRQANERGSLGLKYDVEPPARVQSVPFGLTHANPIEQYGPEHFGLQRHDPEWVNQRTFYHGSGTPSLKPEMLDPFKTDPNNLFGRGIYTTASKDLAKSYVAKGVDDSSGKIQALLGSSDIADRLHELAVSGAFDDLFAAHAIQPLSRKPHHKAGEALSLAKKFFDRNAYSQQMPPGAEDIARLILPDLVPPAPTLYQSQSNFGKILDLDLPNPEVHDVLKGMIPKIDWAKVQPVDRYTHQDPISDIYREAMVSLDYPDPARILRQMGYDAFTHTGGARVGKGKVDPHQVLIALDPNDKLGLGRATPYKIWEAFQ